MSGAEMSGAHANREERPVRDPAAELRQSYEEEDKRWSRKDQVRDWFWLLAMLLLIAGFFLLVYVSEPGLR